MELIFNNNYEIVKYLEKNKKKVEASVFYSRSADDFTNNKTYTQAFEGLKYGDKNYNNVFLDSLKDSEADGNATEYIHDVQGLFYDMGAVVEGIPENAFNFTDAPETKKQAKIYIEIAFSCGVKNTSLLNRGVAIFNLLNTLIIKGYILDVNFICNTYNRKTKKHYNFTFKLPENEINIPTIAFYTSPEFFRVINFVLLDINKANPSYCRGLYNKKNDGLYIEGGYIEGGELNNKVINAISTAEGATNYINNLFNSYITKN